MTLQMRIIVARIMGCYDLFIGTSITEVLLVYELCLWVLPQWSVWTHLALRQQVKHHRGSDVIADHDPLKRDADQVACFPLRDGRPVAVTTQQLIVRWQQVFCPGWATTWRKNKWLANRRADKLTDFEKMAEWVTSYRGNQIVTE